MNTAYQLTRFEGVNRMGTKYHPGMLITDINRLCQIIDEQRQNGCRIYLRDKLVNVAIINSMDLGTVRNLLKGRALAEAVKE